MSQKKTSKKPNGVAITPAHIGETVRELRTALGMTTTTLAKKVGLSQAQVSRLECGQQGFRSDVAGRFAKALKTKPWFFFMTEGERTKAKQLGI